MAKLLVVDDSTLQRRHLESILKPVGYTVRQAGTGKEALQHILADPPDVVITDIHMPEMNGIELVAVIRQDYPTIPVLVTTEFGSEELAVQALKAGASNYIPKKYLARELLRTLEDLLSVAATHKQQSHFLNMMTAVENEFILENNPDLVGQVVTHTDSLMRRMQIFDDSERMRIGVAVHESVVNGIVHGNLEIRSELKSGDWEAYHQTIQHRSRQDPYQNRRVTVTVRATREPMLMVRVKDEGNGFDPKKLPDPNDPAQLESSCGRGLLLIRTFFDTVTYNAKGNEITMVKKQSTQPNTLSS
jgi:CheY-like chemotaxis protein/anti-sigma regulatory factor (Ser/Thr protein kinase)